MFFKYLIKKRADKIKFPPLNLENRKVRHYSYLLGKEIEVIMSKGIVGKIKY